jgi:hypothetical protein
MGGPGACLCACAAAKAPLAIPNRRATEGETPALVAVGRTGCVPRLGRASARRAADIARACDATPCEPLMTEVGTAVIAR